MNLTFLKSVQNVNDLWQTFFMICEETCISFSFLMSFENGDKMFFVKQFWNCKSEQVQTISDENA